jgi:soluble lytic murein transglycosylase-like protein
VERWRTITALATQTVQETTGVRLDPDLVLALVAVESGGQPDARSASGAVGLTQVQPATFADLRTRYGGLLVDQSVERPATNLLAGALYMADCARVLHADLTDPGDLNLVLDAYNLGPRAVLEWRATGTWTDQSGGQEVIRDQLPAETIEHAARIMAAHTHELE